MAKKKESLIQFVRNVNEDTIRITNRGRDYWEENPQRDISKSDL